MSWYSSTSTWSNSPAQQRRARRRAPASTGAGRRSRGAACSRLRTDVALEDGPDAVGLRRRTTGTTARATAGSALAGVDDPVVDARPACPPGGSGRPPATSRTSPRSWRTKPNSSAASPWSRMVNAGVEAQAAAVAGAAPGWRRRGTCRPTPARRRRRPRHPVPASRPARASISWAARRLKVSRHIRFGSTPDRRRRATRWASVPVLPVPAPARTSRGPSVVLDGRPASCGFRSNMRVGA